MFEPNMTLILPQGKHRLFAEPEPKIKQHITPDVHQKAWCVAQRQWYANELHESERRLRFSRFWRTRFVLSSLRTMFRALKADFPLKRVEYCPPRFLVGVKCVPEGGGLPKLLPPIQETDA